MKNLVGRFEYLLHYYCLLDDLVCLPNLYLLPCDCLRKKSAAQSPGWLFSIDYFSSKQLRHSWVSLLGATMWTAWNARDFGYHFG